MLSTAREISTDAVKSRPRGKLTLPLLFDSSRAHKDGAGGEEVEDREGRLGEHGEKMAGGEVSGTFWARGRGLYTYCVRGGGPRSGS